LEGYVCGGRGFFINLLKISEDWYPPSPLYWRYKYGFR
jgi:hypothetical protein